MTDRRMRPLIAVALALGLSVGVVVASGMEDVAVPVLVVGNEGAVKVDIGAVNEGKRCHARRCDAASHRILSNPVAGESEFRILPAYDMVARSS